MADPRALVDSYPLYVDGRWVTPESGRYRGDDEAVAIANNSQYGLSGAVWGADVDRAVAVARRVRTGQIAVNGCIPGDAPFGGSKQSGLGREGGGLRGLHRYMEPKAIGIPA